MLTIVWSLRPGASNPCRGRVVVECVEVTGVDVLRNHEPQVRRAPSLLLELARLADVLWVLLLVVRDRDRRAVLLRRWRRISVVLLRLLGVQGPEVPVRKLHYHLRRVIDIVDRVVHSWNISGLIDRPLFLHYLAQVADWLELYDVLLSPVPILLLLSFSSWVLLRLLSQLGAAVTGAFAARGSCLICQSLLRIL